MTITHAFVSAIADGSDTTLVRPSNWNAAHTIADSTITEAMLSIADNTTKDLSTTAHGFAPKAPNNTTQFLRADATWAAPTASAALSGITAATASNTIANGNNTGQVWNWANTSDSTIAFTFGETSAATNGTSTSGIPNQVLCRFTTLAASTQSPLQVYSRAAHVFSVSPTAVQILAANGTAAAPIYSFAGQTDLGIYNATSGQIGFSTVGTQRMLIDNQRVTITTAGANASNPRLGLNGNTTGIFTTGTTQLGITLSQEAQQEWTSGASQFSKGSANTVSYAINVRKSRGTVASPTVITSGDDLLTITGQAYVGSTNTYRSACQILFDSTGTISDATTGVGGIISFLTMKQGTDSAAVERFRVDDQGHLVSIAGTANTPTISAGGGTNPSITGTDSAFVVTIGSGGIATSVTVAWANNYANAPCVFAESDTDIISFKIAPTTTNVVITATAAFTAGSKLYCGVLGYA